MLMEVLVWAHTISRSLLWWGGIPSHLPHPLLLLCRLVDAHERVLVVG